MRVPLLSAAFLTVALAASANAVESGHSSTFSVHFENPGNCLGEASAWCSACALTLANALGRDMAGDARVTILLPSVTPDPLIAPKSTDVRIVFPSMQLEHSDGIAFGFGECHLVPQDKAIADATIWLRMDNDKTGGEHPISRHEPTHLPSHLGVGETRLLGTRARAQDLATWTVE